MLIHISESRRKRRGKKGHGSKRGSDRSKYLKMLFNVMKGELGDGLIRSYIEGDSDKFREYWNHLTKAIEEEVAKGKDKNTDKSEEKDTA